MTRIRRLFPWVVLIIVAATWTVSPLAASTQSVASTSPAPSALLGANEDLSVNAATSPPSLDAVAAIANQNVALTGAPNGALSVVNNVASIQGSRAATTVDLRGSSANAFVDSTAAPGDSPGAQNGTVAR